MTECSLTNIGSCIVEQLFESLLRLLNLQIIPLMNLIESLLIQPVNIDLFLSLWTIIIYMLSLFYGILLLVAGVRFTVSGYSPEQREKAKKSLTNIIIMMILIQISFFLYSLSLEIFSSLTAAIFNMIDNSFFYITLDGLTNIGLELSLSFIYVAVLIVMIIFLVLRYICVAFGVIFFPIGIFFYFFEPLHSYGKLIINYLLTIMSLPFFYVLIFLVSSMLLDVGIFGNFKIILMIGSFCLVIVSTLLLILFVAVKAALTIAGPVSKITKLVGSLT